VRFLLCVLDSRTGSADASEMASIDAFNEDLVRKGHWVLAAGLADPASTVVVDARGDDVSLQSGPAFTTAEYTSGFWIIEAADASEATAIAQAASRSCQRRVEMRPFLSSSRT